MKRILIAASLLFAAGSFAQTPPPPVVSPEVRADTRVTFRFRAPNVMLLRASFEHSIYKLPIGVILMIDEGKVANQRSQLDFTHLQHSYTAGLTLHAGGLPVVQLLFSWGGHEGTHTTASVNTSLLGGGGRPSLF